MDGVTTTKVSGRRCPSPAYHKTHNVLEHLPDSERPRLRRALAEAYALTDPALAKRRLLQLAAGLERAHPGAAASLREGARRDPDAPEPRRHRRALPNAAQHQRHLARRTDARAMGGGWAYTSALAASVAFVGMPRSPRSSVHSIVALSTPERRLRRGQSPEPSLSEDSTKSGTSPRNAIRRSMEQQPPLTSW